MKKHDCKSTNICYCKNKCEKCKKLIKEGKMIDGYKQKIKGIFCGSFNPITLGHYNISRLLLENNIVDNILFVPVSDGYKKKDLIKSSYRLEMIKLQIEHNKKMEVSDLEIEYFNKNNVQLETFETLRKLKDLYKNEKLALIIGADNLQSLITWGGTEEILSNNYLIVIRRNEYNLSEIIDTVPLLNKYKHNIISVDSNIFNYSSTQVRKDIKYNKKSNLISQKVYQYIDIHNLYR